MKLGLIPLFAATLVGCATPPAPQPKPAAPTVFYRYPMPPNAEKFAQYMAAHDLKDPESAKFRDTFFVTADGRGDNRDKSKDSWCVEVNGKNSYGAYTGYSWALFPAGGTKMIQGGAMAAVVEGICSKAVYGSVSVPPSTLLESHPPVLQQ